MTEEKQKCPVPQFLSKDEETGIEIDVLELVAYAYRICDLSYGVDVEISTTDRIKTAVVRKHVPGNHGTDLDSLRIPLFNQMLRAIGLNFPIQLPPSCTIQRITISIAHERTATGRLSETIRNREEQKHHDALDLVMKRHPEIRRLLDRIKEEKSDHGARSH